MYLNTVCLPGQHWSCRSICIHSSGYFCFNKDHCSKISKTVIFRCSLLGNIDDVGLIHHLKYTYMYKESLWLFISNMYIQWDHFFFLLFIQVTSIFIIVNFFFFFIKLQSLTLDFFSFVSGKQLYFFTTHFCMYRK